MTSVVASVGTDHHRFDRLVGWLDAFASANPDVDVFVQHGSSTPPRVAAGAKLLPLDDLRARFRAADAIVTHGGPATIMDAIDAGCTPLVVPRRPELGEHVDDHQVLFTERLAREGRIVVVDDDVELASRLAHVVHDPSASRSESVESALPAAVTRFAELVRSLQP